MRGRVVGGRYRLEALLGRGGGGAVWRAEHVGLSTAAAVKLLHRNAATPEALARFKCEARAAASLRCANVVQILDYGVEDGTPYIAMELLEGESLAARMARRRKLSPGETASVLTQVARALDQAHEQGIVHRDLKPDDTHARLRVVAAAGQRSMHLTARQLARRLCFQGSGPSPPLHQGVLRSRTPGTPTRLAEGPTHL